MEFDKSKVYTAVNADELEVGSKCLFANSINDLKEKIQDKVLYIDDYLYSTYPDCFERRFVSGLYKSKWSLAYLVECQKEPPTEKSYKPFSSIEKAVVEIKKHGSFVTHFDSDNSYLLIGYGENGLLFDNTFWTTKDLFNHFVFADDNTPCGELVIEENQKEY